MLPCGTTDPSLRRLASGVRRLLWLVCASAALLAATAAPAAKSPSDLADFDFVVAKVQANYSGWETKTEGARRAELDALTNRLRAEIRRDRKDALQTALKSWIAWFDDGHLQVQWSAPQAVDVPWRIAPRPIDEAQARARLASLGDRLAPVEGLWSIDDRYRLAVLRRGQRTGVFDAIVLATTAEGWRAGDVKAVLTTRTDGSLDISYGAADKTLLQLNGRVAAAGDILEVENFGVWRRLHDDPAEALAASRRWPGDEFAITRIDANTLYLRLPSFGDSHTETVRTLVAKHAEELARTPHLVVDVRRNGGGSDFVYDPVLPYLYTRPIWRVGVDIRVSPDNRRLRAEVAERIAASSPEAARTLRSESARMATATTPFIRREPPVEIVRLASVLPNPVKVAVLIDGAGSSAENFIMDARQSRKVVLMGQAPSAGVIDFGEMMSMEAPSARFTLAWATTRSLRLPGDPVDPNGIAPDVQIPKDVSDPVAYAANWLAGR